MKELDMTEIQAVNGGNILVDYVIGKAIDFTVDAVLSGKVDYTSAVEQSGTGYCMLGA